MKISVKDAIWFQTEAEVSGDNGPHSWGASKYINAMPVRSLILIGTLVNQPRFTDEETEAQRVEMISPRSNNC